MRIAIDIDFKLSLWYILALRQTKKRKEIMCYTAHYSIADVVNYIINWSLENIVDNKKLKQGHFEIGIHCVNFMPISNRCARKRAALCPLAKCYQESAVVKPSNEW